MSPVSYGKRNLPSGSVGPWAGRALRVGANMGLGLGMLRPSFEPGTFSWLWVSCIAFLNLSIPSWKMGRRTACALQG